MDAHVDFTHISKKNLGLQTRLITVANGAIFKVLDLNQGDVDIADNVIYMHVNKLAGSNMKRNA